MFHSDWLRRTKKSKPVEPLPKALAKAPTNTVVIAKPKRTNNPKKEK